MTRILLHYNGFVLPLEVDEHRPFKAILRDGHRLAAMCGVSERDYLTCEIPEQPQGLQPIKVWTDQLLAKARANIDPSNFAPCP